MAKSDYGQFGRDVIVLGSSTVLTVGIVGWGLSVTPFPPWLRATLGGGLIIILGLGVGFWAPRIGAGMICGGLTLSIAYGSLAIRNRILAASTKTLPTMQAQQAGANAGAQAGGNVGNNAAPPAQALPGPPTRFGRAVPQTSKVHA